jgi:hypothetical protein
MYLSQMLYEAGEAIGVVQVEYPTSKRCVGLEFGCIYASFVVIT